MSCKIETAFSAGLKIAFYLVIMFNDFLLRDCVISKAMCRLLRRVSELPSRVGVNSYTQGWQNHYPQG